MELKIQCQCGVKYALDVTPETAVNPVRFVCQYCGVDSSAMVNQIIRQQFATPVVSVPVVAPVPPPPPAAPVEAPRIRLNVAGHTPAVAAPAPTASATTTPSPPAPSPAGAPKIKIQLHTHAAPAVAPAETTTSTSHPCLKHPGHFATEECIICKKPICPKCMELFGYVCSAYCEGQAERQKIAIPYYAGKKTVVEGKYWRKVKLVSGAIVLLTMALLGAYAWYYFVGSHPRVVYSLKLPPADYNSFCKLISKDEVILRHGNKLSRHDLKNDKELWSVTLIDQSQVAKVAQDQLAKQKAEMAQWKARRAKLKAAGKLDEDDLPEKEEKPISDEEQLRDISKWIERTMVSQARLYQHGQNIWVVSPAKAVQYNLQSGKAEKEIPVPDRLERVLAGDGSVLLMSAKENGGEVLTRLDLGAGDVRTEELAGQADPSGTAPSKATAAAAAPVVKTGSITVAAKGKLPVALKAKSGATNALAQPIAIRRATPRMQEMDSEPDDFPVIPGVAVEHVDSPRTGTFMVFADENVAQMEIKVLQKNFVRYKAFKDKPKVSELDKGVSAANAVSAMNELVNEMEADRTGGMRTEDESRYQVTIKRLLASGVAEWTGEVVGPASLFSSKTVDVLTAGKGLYVFDKANKKLWESKLAYPVDSWMLLDSSWFDDPQSKRKPFVERGPMLYFFDQGVLTAFETASGNVKWRLTSIGISSVQFDDKGMLYVSTSSAGAESLKYTGQIDLGKRVQAVIMKVDPQNGKILWKIQRTGSDIYFSGKYMYTVEDVPAGGMRIYRVTPGSGKPVWEHYIRQHTTNRDFQANTIQLLYDNELQVLRFL